MSGRGSPPASPGEQGSAMLVVATILAALLAGGGVALYLQLEGTKSVSLTRSGLSSLYCAEAGVAKAQSFFTSQVSLWPDFIDGIDANDPAGYPVTGDIDGDGTADYEVRLADNDDEPSGANDTTVDLDGRVFMIARCLQNPEVPRMVMNLIDVGASGFTQSMQKGCGPGHSGNCNR